MTGFVLRSRQGSADQLPRISGFTQTARSTFPEYGLYLEVICITSAGFHAGSAFIGSDPSLDGIYTINGVILRALDLGERRLAICDTLTVHP